MINSLPPPTPEQNEVRRGFQSHSDLKVNSYAATGKTTLARYLSHDAYDMSQSVLYLAYNAPIVEESRAKFEGLPNVTCMTFHSLAWRGVGKYYDKRRRSAPRLNGIQVARRLGVESSFRLPSRNYKSAVPMTQIGRLVTEMVNNYSHSADYDLLPKHVPMPNGIHADDVVPWQEYLLPLARSAWQDLQQLDGLMKFDHDHYVKLYQLTQPKIFSDVILIDEAQDMNPVAIDVLIHQYRAQKIWVGDEYQQIYGWRGAKNAMSSVPGAAYYLTQSFRFGLDIADEANKWLDLLGAPVGLKGYAPLSSTVTDLPDLYAYQDRGIPLPTAILCRTNAGAMDVVSQLLQLGSRPAIVGGTDSLRWLAEAATDLKDGKGTNHPELFLFSTWRELEIYVNEDRSGSDLKVLVDLVNAYGPERLLMTLERVSKDEGDADVVVSTAHKAKGREWPSVRIHTDYKLPQEGETQTYLESEAMLAYVSVTRAKQFLDRAGLKFIDELGHITASPEDEPTTTTTTKSKEEA